MQSLALGLPLIFIHFGFQCRRQLIPTFGFESEDDDQEEEIDDVLDDNQGLLRPPSEFRPSGPNKSFSSLCDKHHSSARVSLRPRSVFRSQSSRTLTEIEEELPCPYQRCAKVNKILNKGGQLIEINFRCLRMTLRCWSQIWPMIKTLQELQKRKQRILCKLCMIWEICRLQSKSTHISSSCPASGPREQALKISRCISKVPWKQVMCDKHIFDPFLNVFLVIFPFIQFPICIKVEGEFGQQTQFTFDLDPAWTAHVTPRMVPFWHHILIRRQNFKPKMQHLKISAGFPAQK